jgi:hypothetical protein
MEFRHLGSVWLPAPRYTWIGASWMATWDPPIPAFGCQTERPRPCSNHPDASNILYRCCMPPCGKNLERHHPGRRLARSSLVFHPLPLSRRLSFPPERKIHQSWTDCSSWVLHILHQRRPRTSRYSSSPHSPSISVLGVHGGA